MHLLLFWSSFCLLLSKNPNLELHLYLQANSTSPMMPSTPLIFAFLNSLCSKYKLLIIFTQSALGSKMTGTTIWISNPRLKVLSSLKIMSLYCLALVITSQHFQWIFWPEFDPPHQNHTIIAFIFEHQVVGSLITLIAYVGIVIMTSLISIPTCIVE